MCLQSRRKLKAGPWIVEKGTIKAEGHGNDANGYIVTDKKYENFVLSWNWETSEGGNSGMLYHEAECEKFDVPYVPGPEYPQKRKRLLKVCSWVQWKNILIKRL